MGTFIHHIPKWVRLLIYIADVRILERRANTSPLSFDFAFFLDDSSEDMRLPHSDPVGSRQTSNSILKMWPLKK